MYLYVCRCFQQFIYVSSGNWGQYGDDHRCNPEKRGLSGTWDEDSMDDTIPPTTQTIRHWESLRFSENVGLTSPIWQISMWFTRCQTENTFLQTGSARARKREWTYGRLAVVRKPMGKKHHFSEETHHFLWGHFLLPCMFQVTMLYSLNALAQLSIHLLCINWANWFG